MSHGSGVTLEASQDAASLQALKGLAEMGLESVSGGNGLPSTHGFVSMPNTTSVGNVVSSLTLNTSDNSFVGGSVFAPAAGLTSSTHLSNQNRQSGDLQAQSAHLMQHTQSKLADTTVITQQRLHHHLHAS